MQLSSAAYIYELNYWEGERRGGRTKKPERRKRNFRSSKFVRGQRYSRLQPRFTRSIITRRVSSSFVLHRSRIESGLMGDRLWPRSWSLLPIICRVMFYDGSTALIFARVSQSIANRIAFTEHRHTWDLIAALFDGNAVSFVIVFFFFFRHANPMHWTFSRICESLSRNNFPQYEQIISILAAFYHKCALRSYIYIPHIYIILIFSNYKAVS